MKPFRFVIITIACLLFSACAVLNREYVHPVTREVRVCQSAGWGWLGTPAALVMQHECGRAMEQRGYEAR